MVIADQQVGGGHVLLHCRKAADGFAKDVVGPVHVRREASLIVRIREPVMPQVNLTVFTQLILRKKTGTAPDSAA